MPIEEIVLALVLAAAPLDLLVRQDHYWRIRMALCHRRRRGDHHPFWLLLF